MNTSIKLGETKEISFSAGSDTYTRKASVRNIQYFDDKEKLIKDSSSNQIIDFEYYENGQTKKEEYHHDGQLVLRCDYDEYGNLIKSTNADGIVEETVIKKYFSEGKPALAKCGNKTLAFEYDGNGRETKKTTTFSDGRISVQTKEYDSHGRIILLKNDERERTYAYDSKGRKLFDGTNQGESNYCVYSDDEKFKLFRYSNSNESFENIVETVLDNGKKVMCIMYKVIK